MNTGLANLFNVGIILLENLLVQMIADGLFPIKKLFPFRVVTFLLLSAALCLFLFFFGENPIIKYIAVIILFSYWISTNYKATILKSLFSVVFSLAFLTIMDNAVISLIGALLDEKAFHIFSSPEAYYFVCYCTKIVELFCIMIIHIWLKRHFLQGYSNYYDWLRMLIFPLATLMVSTVLLRIFYLVPGMAFELTICNVIILALEISSVFTMSYIEKQQKAVQDNIILNQNIKNEIDNVEAWRKAYDGQRKQAHDFQNQLLAIRGLIQGKAPESQIIEYIEKVQAVDVPALISINTGRTVVDVILSQKMSIAKSREISFDVRLDDMSNFPLPDDELVTVLANLIDNAIEACERIKAPENRYIILKVKVESEAAFLYIENTTAEKVKIVDNRVLSTKIEYVGEVEHLGRCELNTFDAEN